mmetsp:Transcript_40539/g.101857  ORF Transcript_40539/g.101857 Transcript_40539/m.101857 type:complete len:103 (-) Transcript_40539:729-1037(-)
MGAHASCFAAFTAKPKQRQTRTPKLESESFAANYLQGRELGRGSFGSVYSCSSRRDQQEYAVKRIRKYYNLCESVDIDQEANMLKKLAHPSVVKLHAVYEDT